MKKRFTEEPIAKILRDAGTTMLEVSARQHVVSEQSIYRWKRQFGTMKVDNVCELRHLRKEHSRLKKVLAERDLKVDVIRNCAK